MVDVLGERRLRGCVAVIPARAGSKRVPGKNVRRFGGQPLIVYSIRAALDSGVFDRVVVSTDSSDIADIAFSAGAEVPFLRSEALADDQTPVVDVTIDAIERIDPEGVRVTRVAQLMPNCPFRTASDVRASLRQFDETATRSQISVVDYGWTNPWWALELDGSRAIKGIMAEKLRARSQDLPPLYAPTGAIWWADATGLRRERTFYSEGCTAFILPWIRGLDIDTERDWQLAEVLLKCVGAEESS